MRKQIILLLAVFLPLFAFDMNADESKNKVIPLKQKQGTYLQRGMILPIEATFDGLLSSIITSTSSDLGEVSLTVTNLSTGETWYDTFDSSSTPQVVTPISGSTGTYEIVYITESGEVYEGNFML
mgnify:FL=1